MSESPTPESAPEEPAARPRSRAMAVLAGMLLDLVDLMTLGPAGLYGGFLVAGAVGWWAGREFGFEGRKRWLVALVAAVYAATPLTEFVPLGTLTGMLIRLGPRS